ncbi:hypothetical protein K432DRAFT_410906 [Lepidopterella palustris CBS 459.81]|uniref:F-box domain-containing protein n=1 Tax=Lepidopterella palustris CBS 459.81 TaxID=1314670 RepID=A0A8E2DX81_9PEZI|nr:hypothetical protein K432DRAFT_410906 [Lepidopterella palustris CBS 459.81]
MSTPTTSPVQHQALLQIPQHEKYSADILDMLPTEIINVLAEFLDKGSLLALQLVSRRFPFFKDIFFRRLVYEIIHLDAAHLHRCAATGSQSGLEGLLRASAPIEMISGNRETALHVAARHGIVFGVVSLLAYGAVVDAEN